MENILSTAKSLGSPVSYIRLEQTPRLDGLYNFGLNCEYCIFVPDLSGVVGWQAIFSKSEIIHISLNCVTDILNLNKDQDKG